MKLFVKTAVTLFGAFLALIIFLWISPGYERTLKRRSREIASDNRFTGLRTWLRQADLKKHDDQFFHLLTNDKWTSNITSLEPRYVEIRENPRALFLDWGGGLTGSNGCLVYAEDAVPQADVDEFHMLRAREGIYSVYAKSDEQKSEERKARAR